MRTLNVLLLMTLLALFGCGGGGGGASAPNDFSIPTSMTLSADYPTLAVGTGTLTTTTGHYAQSPDEDLTGSVVLSSSNTAVASVAGSTVFANSSGSADITATWSNSNGDVVTTKMTVTVANVIPTSITVTPATATVDPGQTQQFTATADFGTWSQVLFHSLTDWVSDDTSIATINSSGIATGVDYGVDGTANITASFAGVDGQAVINVKPALESISMSANPTHINVLTGDSTQMTVTGLYSDGSTEDLTSQAFYTASTSIQGVVVNNGTSPGLVTGVSAVGTVTITATYLTFTATEDIAVIEGEL
ncbi:MAG: Ig-like domain-containing protein [Desulfuromonadales bacterium]|nr:Ig-like domain-containing protein [Desulfuromonadales bacterium]